MSCIKITWDNSYNNNKNKFIALFVTTTQCVLVLAGGARGGFICLYLFSSTCDVSNYFIIYFKVRSVFLNLMS